ncbi:MAG: hypothetical protein R3F19_13785 [Verrucomicrobiales bacterium]
MTDASPSPIFRLMRKFSDLLIAFAVVVCVEAWLHASADQLAAVKIGDFRSDSVSDCIRKAEQNAPDLDYAVIGSSVTSALDPDALGGSKECERFVLFSADTLGTRRLAEEIVFPNLRPNHVVYVLSPRDVNALSNVGMINASIPDIDLYSESPLRYATHQWVQSNFQLYRYRAHLLSALKAMLRPTTPVAKTEATTPARSGPLFTQFAPSPRWQSDLKALHASCVIQGSELVIVYLPCNPSDGATSPAFREAAGEWHAELNDWCAANRIDCFDASVAANTADHYRDTHHLNEDGRAELTQTFANWIATRSTTGKL